jgi:hypothetical protein
VEEIVVVKPRNDRNQAVTKFCLAMEEHRRSEAGRVRTAKEFVQNFFPYADAQATDKLFHLIPADVRGPILSTWGIRGTKAAIRDSDEKVKDVVHDALVAGDIDETIFEEGVTAQTLVDWVGLPEWWSFWRHGKLTGIAIQKALATARELELIDDRWFFANVQGRGGKLKGTDVVCDTLSKDQIVAWMRKLHETGDGSAAGLVTAIGWETILTKTAQDALLFALDAFAKKTALAPEAAPAKAEAPTAAAAPAVAAPAPAPAAAAKPVATAPAAAPTPEGGIEVAEERPSDSGIPVAVPDIPAIDGADEIPIAEATPEPGMWGNNGESPKLVEARARMMEMLGGSPGNGRAEPDPWRESDVPEKPSALEWPEPPPIVSGGPAQTDAGKQTAGTPPTANAKKGGPAPTRR